MFHWLPCLISFPWIPDSSIFIRVWPFNLTFDQLLFIFNLNLGVNFRGQLLLIDKVKFDNFSLFGILYCKLSIHSKFHDLDIIWLVNLMILTEILILGFFC